MGWLRGDPTGNVAGGGAFIAPMYAMACPHHDDEPRKLLAALAAAVPEMQRRAPALDQAAAFPAADIEQLRSIGALVAPMPRRLGGFGWGTQPDGAIPLSQLLRLLGRGNLSVGRLYEAHVNALRLVVRFGTAAQAQSVARDAAAGHLFALWVTDSPDAPLRLQDNVLHGTKAPCSAAGHVSRALVTARVEDGGTCMLVVPAPGPIQTDRSGWDTHGMRAACNGRVRLDGIRIAPAAVIGGDGDYLRQPDFSAGAWRSSAVALGGLEALVAAMRQQLVARGRDTDSSQQTRIGEALIAQETARLWVARAAVVGEADDGDAQGDEAQDIANTVNLARIAVETACLDGLRLAQRGLGLSAFRQGTLVELLLRDLATYLRQPAPDETLIAAATHFMQRDLPEPP